MVDTLRACIYCNVEKKCVKERRAFLMTRAHTLHKTPDLTQGKSMIHKIKKQTIGMMDRLEHALFSFLRVCVCVCVCVCVFD